MPESNAAGCGTTVAYAIAGALIVGFPAFLAGFVGPIIFTPESNQGPLLGIFITGPIGALVGFIAGAIFSRIRKRK